MNSKFLYGEFIAVFWPLELPRGIVQVSRDAMVGGALLVRVTFFIRLEEQNTNR